MIRNFMLLPLQSRIPRFYFSLLLGLLLPSLLAQAQSGGSGTYQFLNLGSSARIAALGGVALPLMDQDVSLSLVNPSLISGKMDKSLSLNFVDYYSDINYGFAAYSGTLPTLGSYASSVQFINYGTFTRADANGTVLGEFSASEYAFNLGWGRPLDSNFSIGAAIKWIYSNLYDDVSYGTGVDLATTYVSDDKSFTATLVARNLGRQLKAYQSGTIEPLPAQVYAGISKKLKHIPFRYTIIYDRIDKFDLTFDDPLEDKLDPLTQQPIKQDKVGDFFDKLGRHLVIGGEFTPSKALSLRVGYNYGRRQEMGVDTRMSTVGFSWGIGVTISKIQFNYSRATYHLAGSPNYITLSTKLGDFFQD